ncbi:MAG: efflux RND transporter permease subunit [Victivallaceae bacterium]|nr:efflux RND transporter permease subunit [Victivallaceae bacterium]
MQEKPSGFIVGIVETFLTGPLSIIVVIAAIILGLLAVFATPREEEPQIVVPMADVYVEFPGHSPTEVEQLVTVPLEKLLWQIDGVEHVYSISRRDRSIVTVRFYVGEQREQSLIKLRDKISAHIDQVPPGVRGWVVKSVEIDDVPIVTLTLASADSSSYELHRLAEEMKTRLESVRDISKTEILGGYKRQIRIEPNIESMAGRNITLADLNAALQRNNSSITAGKISGGDQTKLLITGPLLTSAEDIRRTVVGSKDGRYVRVEDIAEVIDGPAEPKNYVTMSFGPAADNAEVSAGKRLNAVTMTFSKKRGTNAVAVAQNIIAKAESLRQKLLPAGVIMTVTRNYGKTADAKVNDLINSMVFAILSVVALITFTMGWREGAVVGLAVPVSFALALFVNYIAGYTINRVTLFALILSLGLVVDDPITNVDNIQRHIKMGKFPPFLATLIAVKEVLPPVILSTLAIIISFTPMFFISGMMGPYMGPMAIMVPLTVSFSTFCALTFVPWLSYKLLKGYADKEHVGELKTIDPTAGWIGRAYSSVMRPFLVRRNAFILLGVVLLLLLGSGGLMLLEVPLKMLPFDNKDELQVVLDMPEGTTLEETEAVTGELADYLTKLNEVTDVETYTGINAPIDFNGLVRHYGFRRNENNADIRINLVGKARRSQKSHAIALRIRKDLTKIAEKYNAVLSIVEVPPGPPVLSTITVEVTGDEDLGYDKLIQGAGVLKERLRSEDSKHIVQIDDMSEYPHDKITFTVNRDKASLHGLTVNEITDTLKNAVNGTISGIAHIEKERQPVLINSQLALKDRSDVERLGQIWLKSTNGKMVQLAELGSFVSQIEEQPIYHKNLKRVVFVTAECVGRAPGEIILSMIFSRLRKEPLPRGIYAEWAGEGEWEITLRVFRDLGIAFGIAMLGIYLLMTVQMRSFFMPSIVMLAIPLTIIGIAPGFYLLNLVGGKDVSGYADPVFFTATGMIGMIALGGIVIRNSIVLIEFIQDSLRDGKDIKEAILQSGAVRFRPIVLTALTTMIGAWPITLDPVFSGLAWALIFGLFASTVFTLIVIPAVYMLFGPRSVETVKR